MTTEAMTASSSLSGESNAAMLRFAADSEGKSRLSTRSAAFFIPTTTVDALNRNGILRTVSQTGPIDRSGPFFQSFGTNGRRCSTCHISEDAWTISPGRVRATFEMTGGIDPLFQPHDGATSPEADVSTVDKRREAYAMLLNKGLVRVSLPVPSGAEFELVGVDDPYNHANTADLSLFRRILPTTNLKFLSGVMWDGRETAPGATLHFDLTTQANDATRGHAIAVSDLTDAQRESIVSFETGLFTAQVYDLYAGDLRVDGALGGPSILAQQDFFLGINDPLGLNPTGQPFDPHVFNLFESWTGSAPECDEDPVMTSWSQVQNNARGRIARGQALFNTLDINITGVHGLNDDLGQPTIAGHCTTCHDTPSAGNHSVAAALDIGIADESRRTADMPLYTLRNKKTLETRTTTDPGRALVTGRWKDISRFKGPVLRAVGARAPYFHNGFAANLEAVIDFYDTRFELKLTPGQKKDLVAFLRSL